MSDSEEKKGLGGLARSIDSLFAARPTNPEADDRSGLDPEPGDEGTVAELGDVPPAGGAAQGISESADGRAPDEEPGAGGEAFAGPTEPVFDSFEGIPAVGWASVGEEPSAYAGEPPITPEEAVAADEPAPVSDQPATVSDQPPTVTDPIAGGEAIDAEPTAPEPTAPEPPPPATRAQTPSTGPAELLPEVEEDGDEPGPLAVAVESYLAGGGDAARVRELARRHTEVREYEPVAAAVARLAQGAGRSSDPDGIALAESLLDPVVMGRVVLRLGRERSEARRLGYYEACRSLGEPIAIAIRDELAETGDRSARRAYFDALVAMGEVSRRVIESMAVDENRFLARNGVAILGEIGGGRSEELVVAALANTDRRVRREGLLAMAKLRVQVEDVDQLVVGLLDDTEQSVRLAAVVAAGELGVERAVRPLVTWLEQTHEPDEVLPLLRALGQIGDPGAVPAIEKHAVRELFAKPRTEERIAAYRALHHIGTPHARELLTQARHDKDADVRAVIRELMSED